MIFKSVSVGRESGPADESESLGGCALRLFTADVGAFCENKKQVSAAAYRLLEYAVRAVWGVGGPEIVSAPGGKPYFAGGVRFFSLSHTGTRVLVGVSDSEMGVDVERRREVRAGLAERVMSAAERQEFEFFELWTLREAVFKLTGRGALMSMELRRVGGVPAAPFEGVRCRSYEQIPGCAAAAASYTGDFPKEIENVPPALFLT